MEYEVPEAGGFDGFAQEAKTKQTRNYPFA